MVQKYFLFPVLKKIGRELIDQTTKHINDWYNSTERLKLHSSFVNFTKCLLNSTICPLRHSTVSNHLSSLTSSSRHILLTGRWKTPPAVLTLADRTPPSSPVNTSNNRPIGYLLRTTLSKIDRETALQTSQNEETDRIPFTLT